MLPIDFYPSRRYAFSRMSYGNTQGPVLSKDSVKKASGGQVRRVDDYTFALSTPSANLSRVLPAF
jgi:hypothetical protein